MIEVAPGIVQEVSYLTLSNHKIHFEWQAQCLVKLERDSCCFPHCE